MNMLCPLSTIVYLLFNHFRRFAWRWVPQPRGIRVVYPPAGFFPHIAKPSASFRYFVWEVPVPSARIGGLGWGNFVSQSEVVDSLHILENGVRGYVLSRMRC